jgi:pSer/pThr/pTyr-binding forkhead associated (FHA) protein
MVDRGKHKGTIIPIQKSPFLIGRNDECQLRATNPYVSHQHCELRADGEKIIIQDCLSTNGTFINNQKIEGEVELHEGDELRIGSLGFVVCREDRKLAERRQPEAAPCQSPPSVEEEAAGAMLLELDERTAAQNPSLDDSWGSGYSPLAETVSDSTPETKRKSREGTPKDEPAPTPSDVASSLLKNKRASLLKRRS